MAKGKVTQIIGTVVDIEFPPKELPALFNAVEIDVGGGQGVRGKIVLGEVYRVVVQFESGGWVGESV